MDESEGDSLCGVSECVLAPNLISPVDLVCASHSVSDFEADGPQTPSVSRKRGASVALEREQYKRAKSKHGSGTSPAEACAQKGVSGTERHLLEEEQGRRGHRFHRLRWKTPRGTTTHLHSPRREN